jgi:hypothetical protein
MSGAVISVVGGFYGEKMMHPHHDAVYGSGLRGAAAIARLGTGVELYTYSADEQRDELQAIAGTFGITTEPSPRSQAIEFEYLHGCVSPSLFPDLRQIEKQAPIAVNGEIVIRYGMLEGSGLVDAGRAVYDPQSEIDPEPFGLNGSKAEHLALVLNASEALALSKAPDVKSAAKRLLSGPGAAQAVVIKAGVAGAYVSTKKKHAWVPPRKTPSVFPLGSGDVFTAAFAFQWAHERASPFESAEFASLATAYYCANQFLPLPKDFAGEARRHYPPIEPNGVPGRVYLAAPFFSLGERWVVEQLRNALVDQGFEVFSPLHDVGVGEPEHVAPADLKGLREASVVLACVDRMDPGTLFEIGYARAKKIPVVVLSTVAGSGEDLTMISGSKCVVVHDIASAIYRTAWLLAEGRA